MSTAQTLTPAQAAILKEEKPSIAGWVWAAVLVAVAHLILAYFILRAHDDMPDGVVTPPAIMIDLAPVPVAPPAAQEDMPPAPVKTEEAPPEAMTPPEAVQPPEPAPLEPPPPVVEPPAQMVTVPEAPLAPKPEAVLPPPKPEPQPKPAPKAEKKIEKIRPEHKPEAQRTAAPRRSEAAPAARAAAPQQRAGTPSMSNAEWGGMVRARIMSVKSCPSGASGVSGVVTVSFSVTGSGGLAGAHVSGSSGSASLDAQAASMVRGASPYPPTPTGGTVSLSIPIRFGC